MQLWPPISHRERRRIKAFAVCTCALFTAILSTQAQARINWVVPGLLGSKPYGIAADPDNKYLYIARSDKAVADVLKIEHRDIRYWGYLPPADGSLKGVTGTPTFVTTGHTSGSLAYGSQETGSVVFEALGDGDRSSLVDANALSGMTFDRLDRLWVSDSVKNRIIRWAKVIQPDGGIGSAGVSTFPLPVELKNPTAITAEQETNALWFATENGQRLAKMDYLGRIQKTYELPAGAKPVALAISTADFSDQKGVWYTDKGRNTIAHLDPTDRSIHEFPIPTANSKPTGIVIGSDDCVWFTEMQGNKLGRIEPRSREITEISEGIKPSGAPALLTNGPDDMIYFAEHGTGEISMASVGPHVETGAASIKEDGTTVGISGVVMPHQQSAVYWLEYGIDSVQENHVQLGSLHGNERSILDNKQLTGFAHGKTYKYRFAAMNESGTTYGETRSFTTPDQAKHTPKKDTPPANQPIALPVPATAPEPPQEPVANELAPVHPSSLVPWVSIGRRTKLSKNGTAELGIRCLGTEQQQCSGQLTIAAEIHGRYGTIGRTKFIISGRTRRIVVSLNQRVMDRLTHLKQQKIPLTIEVTGNDRDGRQRREFVHQSARLSS